MQLPREVNRRVGRALHDYAMLADGDRVLVAVSGGVDSLVLLWLLSQQVQQQLTGLRITYSPLIGAFKSWEGRPASDVFQYSIIYMSIY